MHVRAEKLLSGQDGCVAVWQLRRAEVSEEAIATLARRWDELHDGVYVAAFGAPSAKQRWRAATLSTPTTFLSRYSAAAAWDIRAHGGLIQAVTAERTIIDLSAHLDDWSRRKMLREALRITATTVPSLLAAVQKHHHRRGTSELKGLITHYAVLQLHRCKSDAEAYAAEVLYLAKRELPEVNHKVAGHEADLSWPAHHLIIEIDGPQFHRDKLQDAHKTAAWVTAGWTVRRIPSDDVFSDPARLIAWSPR